MQLEVLKAGLTLDTITSNAGVANSPPLYAYLLLMLFDGFLYLFLAWYALFSHKSIIFDIGCRWFRLGVLLELGFGFGVLLELGFGFGLKLGLGLELGFGLGFGIGVASGESSEQGQS